MDFEPYKAIAQERAKRGGRRRRQAEADFPAAAALAERHGMTLVRHQTGHYALSDGHWLLNLYPGNGRLYADGNRDRAPFLGLGGEWGLEDAVRAAQRGA